MRNKTDLSILPIVKKTSVNAAHLRPNSDLPPNFVRPEKFCIFADVTKCDDGCRPIPASGMFLFGSRARRISRVPYIQ